MNLTTVTKTVPAVGEQITELSIDKIIFDMRNAEVTFRMKDGNKTLLLAEAGYNWFVGGVESKINSLAQYDEVAFPTYAQILENRNPSE